MTTDTKPDNHKISSRISFVVASFIISSFILPLSAIGEDSKSIDTLRQLGKAFAEVAEKASPAVVTFPMSGGFSGAPSPRHDGLQPTAAFSSACAWSRWYLRLLHPPCRNAVVRSPVPVRKICCIFRIQADAPPGYMEGVSRTRCR